MKTKTKDDKASLENVMWLLERVNARENPITTRQMLQFGKFPDGILPRDCLEARRLPDTYRTTFSTSDQAVWDLSVTPKGEPCIITKINRMNAVVCGEKIYSLIPDSDKVEGKVALVGFTDTALPVTRHHGDIFEPYDVPPYIIFKGNEKFLEDDGLYCPALTRNGDIVSVSRNGKDGFKVCRNNQVLIAHTVSNYAQFFEDEDGTILCRWRRKKNCEEIGRERIGRVDRVDRSKIHGSQGDLVLRAPEDRTPGSSAGGLRHPFRRTWRR